MADTPTLDDRLAPVAPLITRAWADGELTDLEIAAVCMALIRVTDGEVSCRETLGRWLDANRPPTAAELAELRAAA
ncbi:MAG: hypothetical protein R3290_04605 [Acidimicrobiia bacterium]|nr:hypothetical protein [Acidimicrobiia bacterium]